MNPPPIEDLLFTLDLCADALPFDLLTAHVRRIEAIRTILTERRANEQRAPARVFTLYRGDERKPHRQE